ncbi:MAG: hypothetical protein ACYDAD_07920 [Acidimicrobiales bacterium]
MTPQRDEVIDAALTALGGSGPVEGDSDRARVLAAPEPIAVGSSVHSSIQVLRGGLPRSIVHGVVVALWATRDGESMVTLLAEDDDAGYVVSVRRQGSRSYQTRRPARIVSIPAHDIDPTMTVSPVDVDRVAWARMAWLGAAMEPDELAGCRLADAGIRMVRERRAP